MEALPANGLTGEWKVEGKTVVVTDATKIEEDDGKVRVGGLVEVDGTLDEKGQIIATKIETEN